MFTKMIFEYKNTVSDRTQDYMMQYAISRVTDIVGNDTLKHAARIDIKHDCYRQLTTLTIYL